jgi:hypothetical protein
MSASESTTRPRLHIPVHHWKPIEARAIRLRIAPMQEPEEDDVFSYVLGLGLRGVDGMSGG